MTAPKPRARRPLWDLALLLPLGLAAIGCGDDGVMPGPTAGWNAITLLRCPPGRDSVAINTCTEPFAGDTVEFDRLYRQTHEWFGARYLGAKLSWPPPADVCRLIDAEGWCFAWLVLPGESVASGFTGDVIWGAWRTGAPHKLRFWILSEPVGGTTLADTAFAYYVLPADSGSVASGRALPSRLNWRSDPPPSFLR